MLVDMKMLVEQYRQLNVKNTEDFICSWENEKYI